MEYSLSELNKMNKQQLLDVAESTGLDRTQVAEQTKKEIIQLIQDGFLGNGELVEQDSTNKSEGNVKPLDKIAKTGSSEKDNAGSPTESTPNLVVKSTDETMKNRKQDSDVLATLPHFQNLEPSLVEMLDRVLFLNPNYRPHSIFFKWQEDRALLDIYSVIHIVKLADRLTTIAYNGRTKYPHHYRILSKTYRLFQDQDIQAYLKWIVDYFSINEIEIKKDVSSEWFDFIYRTALSSI